GDFKSASDAISDDILDSVIICGTPVDCARRFEDYCKTGVTLPILMPVGDVKLGLQTFARLVDQG
ncbi:MAG: hypothetical protein HY619_06710, partial [Thaumarchaeota archaeon]|nr:hypothetical protein [Nitrososphaerota archaeon]